MAIRFLLEGEQSDGLVAVLEFDVPADSRIAAAHSHDGYEETIYGLAGTLVWTVGAVACSSVASPGVSPYCGMIRGRLHIVRQFEVDVGRTLEKSRAYPSATIV